LMGLRPGCWPRRRKRRKIAMERMAVLIMTTRKRTTEMEEMKMTSDMTVIRSSRTTGRNPIHAPRRNHLRLNIPPTDIIITVIEGKPPIFPRNNNAKPPWGHCKTSKPF